MKRLLQIVEEPIKLIKPSEIPEEKSEEIIAEMLLITPLYYGFALMFFIQADLILDGVRNQSEYNIASTGFWVDFMIVSFVISIIGGGAGLLSGVAHGCVISLVYRKNKKVSSQPELFKRVVYGVNLIAPLLFVTALFMEAARLDFSFTIEDLGLFFMASCAASLLISRRFWHWWTHDTTTPNA